MNFTRARVIEKDNTGVNERLLIGDVLDLTMNFTKETLAETNLVLYCLPDSRTMGVIRSSCLEPVYEGPVPDEFQIGSLIECRLLTHAAYKKQYTVSQVHRKQGLLTYQSRGPKRNMLASVCIVVDSKNIACVCNFFEREAYGCRCGRILG